MTTNGGHSTLTIDGQQVTCRPGASLVQARLEADLPADIGVGCFGHGSCGSCRAMIRRGGTRDVSMVLGCEITAETGMVVSFLAAHGQPPRHRYQLAGLDDRWSALSMLAGSFPEVEHCRHCGGCDTACPRGLSIEAAVGDAALGRLAQAAAAFDECVMCDLCTIACPENIAPNHVGVFARRATSRLAPRPPELIERLREIEMGVARVDIDVIDSNELTDGDTT